MGADGIIGNHDRAFLYKAMMNKTMFHIVRGFYGAMHSSFLVQWKHGVYFSIYKVTLLWRRPWSRESIHDS